MFTTLFEPWFHKAAPVPCFPAHRAASPAGRGQVSCAIQAVSNTPHLPPPGVGVTIWPKILEIQQKSPPVPGLTVFPLDRVNRVNLPVPQQADQAPFPGGEGLGKRVRRLRSGVKRRATAPLPNPSPNGEGLYRNGGSLNARSLRLCSLAPSARSSSQAVVPMARWLEIASS